jgi:hypothetical protein
MHVPGLDPRPGKNTAMNDIIGKPDNIWIYKVS